MRYGIHIIFLAATFFATTPIGHTAPAISPPPKQASDAENSTTAEIKTDAPSASSIESDARFRLKELKIKTHIPLREGDEDALARIVARYSGKEVSMKELQSAVYETTQYFRTHGYPAATAYLPPQTSDDGTIHIDVEAGRYGKILIENESHLKTSVIERLTKGLKSGDIIKGRKLETALYNIIGLGGVKAGGLLKAGTNPGESDLTVRVEDGKRDSYVLYAENYGNKSNGRYRYGFNANWHNMSGIGDHLAVNALLSNSDQQNYGFQYDIAVGRSGTKLGFGISHTNYELGSLFTSLGATGRANTLSLYGTTPLWRTGREGHFINYGWDFRQMKDELRSVSYSVEKHSNSVHIGISGFRQNPKTSANYDFTLYTGNLTGDNAHIGGIPLAVAPEGSYTKGVLTASVVQTFDTAWDIFFRFQGQQAESNLDSSEQMYLGGANGVRAYPQGEGSGDEGYHATAELRYHTKVPGLTLSTYFDIGHVKYTHDGTIPGGTTLKGWGIGITWRRPDDFFARIDYARRIGLADNATEDAHARDRIWFQIGKVW